MFLARFLNKFEPTQFPQARYVGGEMSGTNEKEIIGSWIIHHGRKLILDANGPAEFPAIDEAAKAAPLLTKLGQSSQVNIPKMEVRAIAVASGLNPRHELVGLLQVLEKKRLIEQTDNEVSVLGVTTRGSLGYAADMYQDAEPTSYEQASIGLAKITSDVPVSRVDVSELIGDEYHLTTAQVSDFLNRAEEIGFVDKEGEGADHPLSGQSLLFDPLLDNVLFNTRRPDDLPAWGSIIRGSIGFNLEQIKVDRPFDLCIANPPWTQ